MVSPRLWGVEGRSEPERPTWSVFVTVLLQVSDKNGAKQRKALLLLMLRDDPFQSEKKTVFKTGLKCS